MATTTPSSNMSVRIGNRIVTPALPVVDSSDPSPMDLEFDRILSSYIDAEIPLESKHGIETRERVLDQLLTLCRSWIESVGRRLQLPQDALNAAGGQLFTSGSYRLGVHEPGADIDTILVAPNMVTRFDFFGRSYAASQSEEEAVRDPESLAEMIRVHPSVTNFNAVEGAAVPILTFDWEDINIDLLFARIHTASVPPNFDIDDDAVLDGVDSATEKSLNGPRVTNLIAALVSGTAERYQSFLTVVRCVRKWAKARGIYSNKMGYWGGVNINIAVALVVQLYPNACPAALLRRFFLLFKSWRWPNPVMLTKPHDAHYGLQVWSPYNVMNSRQVAPIITPAYPAMNSSLSISRQTLQILHEEICRAHDIIDKIWKHVKTSAASDQQQVEMFHELFQPSDFFISYPYYLSLCIVGPTPSHAQMWTGFVESRLRKLVSDLLGKSLPLSKIQLWPKKFEICVADAAALITQAQRKHAITYFLGFQVDKLRMRGNQLNIEQQLHHFKEYELSRFPYYINGMDIFVKSFTLSHLPKFVFQEYYKDGKKEAMKKRKQIKLKDPKVIEAMRLSKLEKLKAKMAKIQQKAEEKRLQQEEQEAIRKKTKEEDPEEDTAVPDEDELLLENALDKIQSDAGTSKTREEAEQDRKKLLAGELLTEGGGGDSDTEQDDISPDAVSSKQQEDATEDPEILALRKAGYTIVTDDELITFPPPPPPTKKLRTTSPPIYQISFSTHFDIVELDDNGNVIDKGDDNFMPSKRWIGRKGGFEFKLGDRGLGYYRTGVKVVVPSNIAY